MKKNQQEIVIFPGWKKQLEQDGLQALKEKRYANALEHFEKLELYDAANFEILAGKVICLIELGRYDDAIAICRTLMKEDDVNYYKYLHIYVTILFQTSQYGEIVSILEEIFENEDIPPIFHEQLSQIYDLSKNFYEDQSTIQFHDDIREFIHKLDGGSFHEQWRMLSVIRKSTITQYVNDLVPYLIDTKLNPVIKTGILQCFVEQQIDRNMEVRKFDQSKVINPKDLKDILDTVYAKQVVNDLSSIESNDPTLFEFTKQILFRFLYVLYPFTPKQEELPMVSEAVLSLAIDYLQLGDSYCSKLKDDADTRNKWKDYIQDLEKKYFSQLD